MAAAYQTGTATSPTDLLQKLITFLINQGWTQNMSQSDGSGWRAHLSKGGVYVNMRSAMNEQIWAGANYSNAYGIGFYLGAGYNSNAWYDQPGGPVGNGQTYTVGVGMQLPSGSIIAYHFFDDGSDNIVVVVERTAGIFTHMGWGPTLNKAGSWTGGMYFFSAWAGYWMGPGSQTDGGAGSSSVSAYCPFSYGDYKQCSSSFVRADVDSFIGKWLCMGAMTNPVHGYTGKYLMSPLSGVIGSSTYIPTYDTFRDRQTSAMNSQANLLPIRLYAIRDTGGYSLTGDAPVVYWTNAVSGGYGYSAGSVHSIGADNYMMFPYFAVLKKA